MRQLATIQTIAEVKAIEGADAIVAVRVNDWWCVAKKDEFKEGDKCVYFEIDSLLPSDNQAFEFLAKGNKERTMVVDGKEYKGYRLKTIRLRGQISQGLALPLSVVSLNPGYAGVIGDDLSETIGVVKYEPPIPASLAGKVKGNLPSFINKTDEERIQNCGELLEKHKDNIFYITEKLDGTSATFYKHDGVFGVCSRNLDLLETEGNTQWRLARELDLENNLPDGFAVQGEIIGHGIQNNPYGITGQRFYAFNVYDIKASRYLDQKEFVLFILFRGIRIVPILTTDFRLPDTVDELLRQADGSSVLADTPREGLVIRPLVEMREEIRGVEQRLSFKVISNKFLLK